MTDLQDKIWYLRHQHLAFTKPGKNYLQTIIKGIKEAHEQDDKTIFNYLKTKKGINGNYGERELWDIFENW